MAAPEFSETQFVFGFLREYMNSFPAYPDLFWYLHRIRLPSTVEEMATGADFIFSRFTHSEFIQFKRSHCISRRGRFGIRGIERTLPLTFFNYYRFKVYNSARSRQFERLRNVSVVNPNDKAYYCAPFFHTNAEFNQFFWTQTIVENSVLIDCHQFNQPRFNLPFFDIGTDSSHKIVYNDRGLGYLLSEPLEIEIKKRKGQTLAERKEIKSAEIAINELNALRDWCLLDRANKDELSGGKFIPEKMNMSDFENRDTRTLGFIADYLLSTYDIFWLPIINL